MTTPHKPYAPRRSWTPAELATLQAQYPHRKSSDIAADLGMSLDRVYRRAQMLGLRKSAAFAASSKSGRLLKGGRLFVATQFKPGQKPWNAGTHYNPGGRSAETRFKPGQKTGAAAYNWVPIGSYRVSKDGLLEQKITDLGRGPRDWEAVHRLVWKAAHGPIPDGSVITFRPGRKTSELAHITVDALECITRRELVLRNGFWRKDPALARLYQLKGAITRQVNQLNQRRAAA